MHVFILSLVENQKYTLWIRTENGHIPGTAAEQGFDHSYWGIANSNPNHFRRVPEEKTALMEVVVLRYDDKALLCGILPDNCIRRLLQSNFTNVPGVRIFLLQGLGRGDRRDSERREASRGGIDTSFRSRSAAKARQARISSRVRPRKSLRISSSLIPEARYSKTSYTVMRSPRMQGLPPHFSGSMVMRFFQSIG
jgi:hypothetical protein